MWWVLGVRYVENVIFTKILKIDFGGFGVSDEVSGHCFGVRNTPGTCEAFT